METCVQHKFVSAKQKADEIWISMNEIWMSEWMNECMKYELSWMKPKILVGFETGQKWDPKPSEWLKNGSIAKYWIFVQIYQKIQDIKVKNTQHPCIC